MSHQSFMQALAASAYSLSRAKAWQPFVDVYRLSNGWLIKFELAGVWPEDIHLSFDGRCLTLRGVRRDCSVKEARCHYRMEISYSHFERTIELPENIASAEVTSEFLHGMLLVRIESTESA